MKRDPRDLRLFIVGALCFVVVFVWGILPCSGMGRTPPRPIPVVFVHGLGGEHGPDSFAALKLALAARGWPKENLHGFRMTDSNRCIVESAKELKLFVEGLGRGEVDVVGHSLGTLVIREWVKDLGGADMVRRAVLIAGPNHGTTLAKPTPLSCAVSELAPGSPFLTALNVGGEAPPPVLWTTLWSRRDRLVMPPESARLEGARNIEVPYDHVQVLLNAEAHRLVAEALGD